MTQTVDSHAQFFALCLTLVLGFFSAKIVNLDQAQNDKQRSNAKYVTFDYLFNLDLSHHLIAKKKTPKINLNF